VITKNGGGISTADCMGTAGSAVATLSNLPINLPQYLTMPTGVSADWSLSVYRAGDVDHDGIGDLLVIDYVAGAMDLFFGSSSGIVNGTPVRGAAVNHAPQLVTTNASILSHYQSAGGNGAYSPMTGYIAAGSLFTHGPSSLQNYPLAVGDFNGDGYEDLAITISIATPAHDTPWDCSPAQRTDPLNGMCYEGVLNNVPPGNGSPGSHNAVVIIYGSQSGYQTPMSGGAPVEFDAMDAYNCPNFYDSTVVNAVNGDLGCDYASTGTNHMKYWTEAYNTLAYNSSNSTWSVDTTRTACDPTSNNCKAQIIRDPVYYANSGTNGYWTAMNRSGAFGTSLTVADTNHDGIDDLVIGSESYTLSGWNTTDQAAVFLNNTIMSSGVGVVNEGRAFIFYGAKGAGVVAPPASMVVGDMGLGLDYVNNASTVLPLGNMPVFGVYPTYQNTSASPNVPNMEMYQGHEIGGPVANWPANPYYMDRSFGVSTTSGDFNGDGFDDIAVTSIYGQVYIIYGPICQLDNARWVWNNSYNPVNRNAGVKYSTLSGSDLLAATDCSEFNFNTVLASNNAGANKGGSGNTITVSEGAKALLPEVISVTGASQQTFGSVLISQRPTRSVASVTIVKNTGNIDGDPERTSDLIVGTSAANDPNVTPPVGIVTGLGYILFGHKDPQIGDMPTTPGIYVGNSSYNSALLSTTVNSSTYFYHQSVILHPHTADGLTGGFFYYESSAGDLNGDGTMDLIMPTDQINVGADGTPVVKGGGFKIFY